MQYREPGFPGDLRPQVGHASGSPGFGPLAAVALGAGGFGAGGAIDFAAAGTGGFGAGGATDFAAGTGGAGVAGFGAGTGAGAACGFAGAGFAADTARKSSMSRMEVAPVRAGGGGPIGIGNPSS